MILAISVLFFTIFECVVFSAFSVVIDSATEKVISAMDGKKSA